MSSKPGPGDYRIRQRAVARQPQYVTIANISGRLHEASVRQRHVISRLMAELGRTGAAGDALGRTMRGAMRTEGPGYESARVT
jgi:hypothetical protein